MRFLFHLAAGLLITLVVGQARAGEKETWTQWRGPTRDGRVVPSNFQWPDTLAGLEQSWWIGLGDGYASPVVTADRVFVAETKGGKELVRALDRLSGKQIWETEWAGDMSVPFFAMKNGSWIRSSPAFDGDSLYVGGMRDVLVCLAAADGKVRWRVDFVERYKTPLPSFGCVCSPLVTPDGIYMQAGASFVKLDKATGKEVWRSLVDEGGMNGSAFSSPVLATLAGKSQVLVQTRQLLAGLDPESGKVLWQTKIEAFRGMNILTPIPFDEAGVFMSSYGGLSQLLSLKPDGDRLRAEPRWKLRIEANMSTPVVIDKHAYLHRRDKRLSCIDLVSGAEKWTVKADLSDYASLATDGKKILALDSKGDLILIRHDPTKYVQLDRKQVSQQQSWAHVVICGDEVFVREQRGLRVFRWK